MENGNWGYEFDIREISPDQWQSSYWLISPSGELTERTVMPTTTSQDQSMDAAQEAGKAEAIRRNGGS